MAVSRGPSARRRGAHSGIRDHPLSINRVFRTAASGYSANTRAGKPDAEAIPSSKPESNSHAHVRFPCPVSRSLALASHFDKDIA
jgi:hypothetical protein